MPDTLFTRKQVNEIIRNRVNDKNAQIKALKSQIEVLEAGVNNAEKEAVTTETE